MIGRAKALKETSTELRGRLRYAVYDDAIRRLLDLSSMPFTSRYNTAMLNSIARDGKLYCLPCSAQVRDIVYNTILFEEKGWKVPYDFNRFIALCRTIEARGIRSIHLSFGNSELLDTAFGATATEAAVLLMDAGLLMCENVLPLSGRHHTGLLIR